MQCILKVDNGGIIGVYLRPEGDLVPQIKSIFCKKVVIVSETKRRRWAVY
jgi:hypothetical protein